MEVHMYILYVIIVILLIAPRQNHQQGLHRGWRYSFFKIIYHLLFTLYWLSFQLTSYTHILYTVYIPLLYHEMYHETHGTLLPLEVILLSLLLTFAVATALGLISSLTSSFWILDCRQLLQIFTPKSLEEGIGKGERRHRQTHEW